MPQGGDDAAYRWAVTRRDRAAPRPLRTYRRVLFEERHERTGRQALWRRARNRNMSAEQSSDLSDVRAIKDRAADWLERADRSDWSADDDAQLEQWLSESATT